MSTPVDAPLHILHPEVKEYIAGLPGPMDPLLSRLDHEARSRKFPLIGRTSGRWLELLTRATGGRRVFEFGSGFGYSAYFFARAVGPQGEVIGSEIHEHELEVHRQLYGDHELAGRIDIRHGDALEIFAATEGEFDAVLIDVHKVGYQACLDAAVPRLRPGGLLLADNSLWGGKTARPSTDESTAALQAFNRAAYADARLQCGLLPAGDGLLVALKGR